MNQKCYKLIRSDWTDLETGKTLKFAVGEVTTATEASGSNCAINMINFACGIKEWCPLPGDPSIVHKDCILIEIEPVTERFEPSLFSIAMGFNFSRAKAVRTLRQIINLNQLAP